MFRTATCVILHKPLPSGLATASEDNDERSIDDMVISIIHRRLTKLEGLRSYLRRVGFGCCNGSAQKQAVVVVDQTMLTAETIRSPVTKLSTQQSVVVGA